MMNGHPFRDAESLRPGAKAAAGRKSDVRLRVRTWYMVGTALVVGLTSCSSVGRPLPPPSEIVQRVQGPIAREEYRIGVGDRLQIKFPYHGKFDREVIVRPDGKINLEIVGEMMVEGVTVPELEDAIASGTSSRLRNPDVVVIVTELGDRRVYVGGEVGRPGFVLIQEGMTPLQAVLAVGGFKDTAERGSVLYVARANDGAYHATRVDLEDVVKNGTPEAIRLRGNDVVFVPATRIANADLFVEQYIRKMLPVESKAGASAAIPY